VTSGEPELFWQAPAYVVASLQAGSFLGARGNREASAELFRDVGFVVLGRAGAGCSQRIVAQNRYQVNNYLLGMYSNTCSDLGKGRDRGTSK
jgi:hypothetical protein